MQNLTITGRLGRDAVVRETANGDRFLTFTVAVNSFIRGAEKTTWYDVISHNEKDMGKKKDYLTKGSNVIVVGELDASLQTGTDNVQRLRLSISADRIDFNSTGGSGTTQTNTETTAETVAENVQPKTAPKPEVQQVTMDAPEDDGDDLPF